MDQKVSPKLRFQCFPVFFFQGCHIVTLILASTINLLVYFTSLISWFRIPFLFVLILRKTFCIMKQVPYLNQ